MCYWELLSYSQFSLVAIMNSILTDCVNLKRHNYGIQGKSLGGLAVVEN